MKKKLTTSLIGILVVILITLVSDVISDVPSLIFTLLALTLLCKTNKDLNFNNVFLWTFLTYIIGKITGVSLVILLFDKSQTIPFNYSYSIITNTTGIDSYISTWLSQIIDWFMKGKGFIFDFILSVYKGAFVALFVSVITSGKAKK